MDGILASISAVTTLTAKIHADLGRKKNIEFEFLKHIIGIQLAMQRIGSKPVMHNWLYIGCFHWLIFQV